MSNAPATHTVSANHGIHIGSSVIESTALTPTYKRNGLIVKLLSPFNYSPDFVSIQAKVIRYITNTENLMKGIPTARWDEKSEEEKEVIIIRALFADESDFRQSFSDEDLAILNIMKATVNHLLEA